MRAPGEIENAKFGRPPFQSEPKTWVIGKGGMGLSGTSGQRRLPYSPIYKSPFRERVAVPKNVPCSPDTLADPAAARIAATHALIPGAWGQWLDSFHWDHFGTLTFAEAPSLERGTMQFRRWIRRLEQRTQRRLFWFKAGERGPGGMYHFHFLVNGSSVLTCAALRSAWPAGVAHAVRYDARRAAALYVCKDLITSPDCDFELPSPSRASSRNSGVSRGS